MFDRSLTLLTHSLTLLTHSLNQTQVRLRQLLVGAKTDAKIARAQLQAQLEGRNEDMQLEEMCTEKRRLELALRELEEQYRDFVSQSNQREMAALEMGTSRVKSLLRELEATERAALIEEHRRKRCESEIKRLRNELDTKTKIENMISSSKTSMSIRDSREKVWNEHFEKWKEEHHHTNTKIRLFASETERDRLMHRLRDERRSHGETIEKLIQILETAGKVELENHRHPPEDVIFSTAPSHELAASLASARATIGEMERQAVRSVCVCVFRIDQLLTKHITHRYDGDNVDILIYYHPRRKRKKLARS